MTIEIPTIKSGIIRDFSNHYHTALEDMKLYEEWKYLSGNEDTKLSTLARTSYKLAAQLHKTHAINSLVMGFMKMMSTDAVMMLSPLGSRPLTVSQLIHLYDTQTENGKHDLPSTEEGIYKFLDDIKKVLN